MAITALASRRRPRSVVRGLVLTAAMGLVVYLVAATLLGVWERRFFEGYDPELALEARVTETSEPAPGLSRELVFVQMEDGEHRPVLLYRPASGAGPRPAIVLLLWYRARIAHLERAASEYVRRGYVVATPEGLGFRDLDGVVEPRGLARVRSTLRRGPSTFVQARRTVDYLETLPDVDPSRIALAGVSLGGTVVPAVLAHEPRYQAGVLMWTAGRLPSLVDAYVERREVRPPESWLVRLAIRLLDPLEPTEWIGRIDCRPILFQNTRGDEVLPIEAVTALHRAAEEPKTVLWYEGVHEREVTEEVVREALGDQIDWLERAPGRGEMSGCSDS